MTRKFHDYSMFVNELVREGATARRYPEVYRLTHLLPGSQCVVYGPVEGRWLRKTKNRGASGSIRYEAYTTLQAALDAGQAWAWRKDREAARNPKK